MKDSDVDRIARALCWSFLAIMVVTTIVALGWLVVETTTSAPWLTLKVFGAALALWFGVAWVFWKLDG